MAEAEAWVMIPKLDEKRTGCVLDMRPLVLCKDCRRYYANGGNCDQVLADWFCADGKRKET